MYCTHANIIYNLWFVSYKKMRVNEVSITCSLCNKIGNSLPSSKIQKYLWTVNDRSFIFTISRSQRPKSEKIDCFLKLPTELKNTEKDV